MSNDLISKEKLLEPYNIISEFQVKSIGNLENYTQKISAEMDKLNGLDFDQNFKMLMDFGKAISNDVRIKILYFIQRVGKSCFCELENVFDLKQSTLNYHIGLLKRADLIETYKEGKLIVIQLSNNLESLLNITVFQLFSSNS